MVKSGKSSQRIVDSFTEFLESVEQDQTLYQWLERLCQMDDQQRRVEVRQVTLRMTQEGEPAPRVRAVCMLADRRICRAALRSVE